MSIPRIDLHGLTVPEAIAEYVGAHNRLMARGYRGKVEVIHGYGSSGEGGVIREKLRAFLAAHRDRFEKVTTGAYEQLWVRS